MTSIEKLGKMFKERDNQVYLGPQLGTVIASPPNIRVKIGDKIILEKDRLVIAAHVLSGYKRQFQGQSSGSIITKTPSPVTYSSYTELENLSNTGEITYTDTLKIGDEVILMPSTDEQKYFLIDKAVRL
ncbi:Protein of unknown function [Natronincola peptidivorans]|uniref:DUF2577 domain-containing protein n=1 Tax=Natronincola peptidivorans TaxID=426128 RepID=A0A1I0FAX4_9FIRM|nr:DUF2577 domain-containing protein [Natronincola peptidivorans]SET55368.1 Protein of unknown function [Natronincola peptidivorans]